MDDFSRLKQKLAKLGKEGRAGSAARVLRGEGEELLAGILTEFDEVILPRKLSFRSGGSVRLEFAVANRRLQSLLALEPAVGIDEGLFGAEFKDASDPKLALIKAAVLAALDGVHEMMVTATRQQAGAFASDVGIPVDQMAKVWALDAVLDGAAPGEFELGSFLKSVEGQSKGWLLVEGEDGIGHGGDVAVVAELGEKVAIFLDGYLAKRSELTKSDHGARLYTFTSEDGSKSMVFVDAGDQMAFVETAGNAAFDVATSWQKAMSG